MIRMKTQHTSHHAAVQMRPLTARSVVLSVLLGAHPPQLSSRELVRLAALFEISEATLRVALTRMVSAGDLLRDDSTYRLSDRLVERQRRQDDAVQPVTKVWRGAWEMAVVISTGRGAAERAELRTRLTKLRLAELREGVWLRPANLKRAPRPEFDGVVQLFVAHSEEPASEIVTQLWDLASWQGIANVLLVRLSDADRPADRFTIAAAVVRHLLADPVLPDALLPEDWPGAALRSAYVAYQEELAALMRSTLSS